MSNKNLKIIYLDETITEIEDHAFSSCINVVTVYLPKGLRKIGNSVFFCCFNLENIILYDQLLADIKLLMVIFQSDR